MDSCRAHARLNKVALAPARPGVSPKPLIADLGRVTLAYNQGAAFSTHFGPYQRWLYSLWHHERRGSAGPLLLVRER